MSTAMVVGGAANVMAGVAGLMSSGSGRSEPQVKPPAMKESPRIKLGDLQGKTPDELRQFASDQGLVPHATKPDKSWAP